MICSTKITISALVTTILTAPLALAEEIFTWRDGDGVIHYSQWAPEDSAAVSTLVVNSSNPPNYDPLEDPYSIQNQAARMNKAWLVLEEKRSVRREKRREETANTVRYVSTDFDPYPYYTSSYYYAPGHRPEWRPILRPGIRPPHSESRLQRPGLVDRVQRRQFNATSSNHYDPFRSAGISAPESGRQTSRPPVDF